MYQLTQARHDMPPTYWRCITEELEVYLARCATEEQHVLPSFIIEPRHAYEYEERVAPFEHWGVASFGFYLAAHWLGHSFKADAAPDDVLPRRLVDVIRRRLGPTVPRSEVKEFEESLDGLTYSGLSASACHWWDLVDGTVTWPGFDPGVAVQDLYNDFWQDHEATAFEWLHACRVTHLEVRTEAFDELYGAEYGRAPYDRYIEWIVRHHLLEVVRPETHDESDPEQAALLYRHPVRGGGFSCMR